MNEKEFGGKVSRLLQQGADQVDAATAAKLKAARLHALEHYRAREPLFGLAWAGTATGRIAARLPRPVLWAPALALLLAMATALYWQQSHQQNDSDEIDALLLSSDLPINAYIDKDFDAWPKGSSR
jgi:type VI protein secretion system component VasF